jgi:hypothetical protein
MITHPFLVLPCAELLQLWKLIIIDVAAAMNIADFKVIHRFFSSFANREFRVFLFPV